MHTSQTGNANIACASQVDPRTVDFADFLPCFHFPKDNWLILATRGQQLAVRGKGRMKRRGRSLDQAKPATQITNKIIFLWSGRGFTISTNFLPRLHVPQSYDLVLASCQDAITIWQERHERNLLSVAPADCSHS